MTDTSRSGDLMGDDFAPIWDESILLAEHEAVQASVDVGGWLSAALDDPNVCDAMKADINRWFSAGFLYLDEVRKLMQTEREALEAENERLREQLSGISGRLKVMREALIHTAGICNPKSGFLKNATGVRKKHIENVCDIALAALGEKQ